MPHTDPQDSSTRSPATLRQALAKLKHAYNSVFYPVVPDEAPAQKKWEASVEGPMLLVSVIFLILFTGAALGKTDARGTQIAELGMWLTWLIFGIDYVVRLALARPRFKWFFTHIHELIVVLLPWFRPLRVLRVVPVLFLMQRFSAKSQRVTVAIYTGIASSLMILVATLTIYDAEYGQPGSNIKSFWDAFWWSIVTVTTVGYGDITPVTGFGRGVGVVLMIGGIAVAGVVTATVAAWLVEQVSNDVDNQDLEKQLMSEVVALREEIATLRKDVAAARSRVSDQNTNSSATAQSTTTSPAPSDSTTHEPDGATSTGSHSTSSAGEESDLVTGRTQSAVAGAVTQSLSKASSPLATAATTAATASNSPDPLPVDAATTNTSEQHENTKNSARPQGQSAQSAEDPTAQLFVASQLANALGAAVREHNDADDHDSHQQRYTLSRGVKRLGSRIVHVTRDQFHNAQDFVNAVRARHEEAVENAAEKPESIKRRLQRKDFTTPRHGSPSPTVNQVKGANTRPKNKRENPDEQAPPQEPGDTPPEKD